MELLTQNKPSSPDPLHQEVTFKRPLAFTKMENLIKEMQDPEHGVPVRPQKLFLSSIPAAFAGYDIIEWLMERLSIEDSVEAIHLSNLLCQHGYFFPVGDNKAYSVKDDSSLYRFQTPYYWPSQYPLMDSVDYAIYLAKRTLRNKQKHGLDDYEVDALAQLKRNLNQKWDFISMQADEQVRINKERKKIEKMVIDAQEKAFWRVLRPPPGISCCVETPPMYKHDFHAKEGMKQIRRTNLIEDLRAEVDLLRTSCIRTRIKVSQALESLASHCESYHEHDPFLVPRQPSNPWISDDPCYWIINAPLIEIPTERRVKKWSISMEDLVLDPTGLREITTYLKKEYCHENIRFWLAVRDLRYGPTSQLRTKAQQIYNEFLSPGAPCEINIDMRTMEAVQKEFNYLTPSRFTFDPAAEHVYTMLLKKDCYPRFIRSEQYKSLLANALQPINQKKRLDKFLSYLALGKKKSSTATPPIYPVGGVLSIPPSMGLTEMFKAADEAILMATGNKSDLLSASSLDTDKLSVMADCPYRSQGSFDDVCPWESMEKLPEKDKGGSSLSQSVTSTSHAIPSTSSAAAKKPSTSAAALMHDTLNKPTTSSSSTTTAVATNASKAVASTSKAQPMPSTSAAAAAAAAATTSASSMMAARQESMLSKQGSISSTASPAHQRNISPTPSTSSSAALLDNQQHSKPAPPQHRPSVSSDSRATGGASSSTTSLSKDSVIHASPSTSIQSTSRAPLATVESGSVNGASRKVSIPVNEANMVGSGGEKQTSVKASPIRGDSMSPCASPHAQQQPPLVAIPSTSSTSSSSSNNKPSTSTSDSSTTAAAAADNKNNMQQQGQTGRDNNKEVEVCPWDHENGTRPESITFVKTYSTLGYL